MQYFIVQPALYERAARAGQTAAHAAFRVSGDGHLLGARLPDLVRGGVMVLGAPGGQVRGDGRVLAREILQVCAARNFSGVLCDFEPPLSPVLAQAVAALTQSGRTVWVHEAYAHSTRGARVLISSAISGGSLSARLGGAAAKYGPRIALAVRRARLEFHLPDHDGTGRELSPQELAQLLRRLSPAVFESPELCAHYFTHRTQGDTRFVLFDNAHSIRQKLQVAERHGVRDVFFAYPEVEDLPGDTWG